MSLSKPSSRKCYYETKQKRVDQLLGSGYGWQAIYEKLISEGYYK